MMDIKNPEYFIMLADRRNMSRAAEALGLSQPSLSYYLTRLEQDLGCSLFHRRKGELELTAAGQLYLEAARQTAALRDQVYERIRRLDRENRLWVTAGEEWTEALLAWVLPRFRERFPSVQPEVELSSSKAEALLRTPSLPGERPDFCLGSAAGEVGQVLSREALYLALPEGHPYLTAHPHTAAIGPDALGELFQRETLLAPRPGSCLSLLTEQLLGETAVKRSCPSYTLEMTRCLLTEGRGLAILPRQSWPCRWLKLQPEVSLYRVLWQSGDSTDSLPRRYFAQLCREFCQK